MYSYMLKKWSKQPYHVLGEKETICQHQLGNPNAKFNIIMLLYPIAIPWNENSS